MFRLSLNEQEREMVFLLASELTGTCQSGNFRHEILVTNVLRRMHKTSASSLEDYLSYVEDTPAEMPHLLSALTIHTTNWFREKPHYLRFEDIIKDFHAEFPNRKFTMLCAASSTGEEPNSFGLVLQKFRSKNPKFDYEVYGRDIDPVSVNKGQRCVYPIQGMNEIPKEFHEFLLKGSGKTEGLFTLDKEIRKRCFFSVRSLTDKVQATETKFDYIVCRNVLIYFSSEEVENIVRGLLSSLTPNGLLTVGHSEALDYRKFGITSLGHSTYSPLAKESASSGKSKAVESTKATGESSRVPVATAKPIATKKTKYRVLVVDDSTTVRSMMCKLIEGDDFETIPADSAASADVILKNQSVDLITLDLHMPGKDGQVWLLEQRASGMKTPVIIVSDANPAEAQAVLNILGNGAQDYIEKKDLSGQKHIIRDRLKAIIDHKAKAPVGKNNTSIDYATDISKLDLFYPDVILLGASTGGTEALVKTLKMMPANCPPIVVVQHISADFAQAFATRLASNANLKLAPHQPSVLQPGYLYTSVKDEHIGLTMKSSQLYTDFSSAEKVSSHRPSVDHMFKSAASLKVNYMAILLTGMGKDGADGLLQLKKNGAMTVCQDSDSSVVWGMPGEATKIGAPKFVGNPEEIRKLINASIVAQKRKKVA